MGAGYDTGSVVKSTLDTIFNTQIPLSICTDSKSLYDCLVRLGTAAEKRLMIDIWVIRKAYERREIAEIKWIAGDSNPADALTKRKGGTALSRLIESNRLDIKALGWVQRPIEPPNQLGETPEELNSSNSNSRITSFGTNSNS